MSPALTIDADPYAFVMDPARCALIIIDMQRDFLEPGGFGDMLGNDVALLRRTIAPTRLLLEAWRRAGLLVIHTREGHRADLSDLPRAKRIRGRGKLSIGDSGPMGRILVRGEVGHGIVADLTPIAGEPVIDKPGKGAFFATDLQADPAEQRHPADGRHRRDNGGLRAHDRAGGERSRLRLPRRRGLRRVVCSGVSGGRSRDDLRAGRNVRLGRAIRDGDRRDRWPAHGRTALTTAGLATTTHALGGRPKVRVAGRPEGGRERDGRRHRGGGTARASSTIQRAQRPCAIAKVAPGRSVFSLARSPPEARSLVDRSRHVLSDTFVTCHTTPRRH